MHYIYLESAIREFEAGGLIDPRETLGCSEEEITYLESIHPAKVGLPKAFQEFLKYGGKKIGDLKVAPAFYYDFIIFSTQNLSNSFLREGYRWKTINEAFPKDGLIFMNNQDYEFLFIRLTEGDDPQVYHALEGNSIFCVIDSNFSQFLLKIAQNYRKIHINLPENLVAEILNLKVTVLDIIDSLNTLIGSEGVLRFIDRYRNALRAVYDLQSIHRQQQLDKASTRLKREIDCVNLFQKLVIPQEEKQKIIMQMSQALQQFYNLEGKLRLE